MYNYIKGKNRVVLKNYTTVKLYRYNRTRHKINYQYDRSMIIHILKTFKIYNSKVYNIGTCYKFQKNYILDAKK